MDFKLIGHIGNKAAFRAIEENVEIEVLPDNKGKYCLYVSDLKMGNFDTATDAMEYAKTQVNVKDFI